MITKPSIAPDVAKSVFFASGDHPREYGGDQACLTGLS
jgi:hypothetical protein